MYKHAKDMQLTTEQAIEEFYNNNPAVFAELFAKIEEAAKLGRYYVTLPGFCLGKTANQIGLIVRALERKGYDSGRTYHPNSDDLCVRWYPSEKE
jgi:hypothetical protein